MGIAQAPPPQVAPRTLERIYTRRSGRVRQIRLLLLSMDVLAVLLLQLLAASLVSGNPSPWRQGLGGLLLSLLCLPLILYFNGAYGLASVQSAVRMVRALCLALPEYAVAITLLNFFFPVLGLSTAGILFGICGAGVAVAASRVFLFSALQHTKAQHNVLIIGAGWSGKAIGEILADIPNIQYHVVGYVDDDPLKWEKEVLPGCPVLGATTDLAHLILEYQVSELVLAINEQLPDRLFSVLGACAERGVRAVNMANLYEEITGKVPVKHIDDQWFLYCFSPERQRMFEAVKRGVDVCVSLVALFFLALIYPFIGLAIVLESGKPILYRQVRVGRGGKSFRIIKFRTMVQNAEKHGAVWAAENDSRITRVGAFLRKTRIDELPQLWNVLRGDMSLVGPRPERPEFVQQLADVIPFYNRRHAVIPGITGWAQVKYRYGASVEDSLQKLQYDLYYINHRSLFLD
ncbi:MAG TPA: exopolysaccharide biosynthesis polyprenyl glycosylphosphotransferase, partial [Armatimonadota bacterium]|nr:exopolysaccharide biosynthesis polyprenyl glycosylphosphotransferase [Armatimonadota bacterium]